MGRVVRTRVSFQRTVQPRQYSPVVTLMEDTIEYDEDDDVETLNKLRRRSLKQLKADVDRISSQILRDEKPDSD